MGLQHWHHIVVALNGALRRPCRGEIEVGGRIFRPTRSGSGARKCWGGGWSWAEGVGKKDIRCAPDKPQVHLQWTSTPDIREPFRAGRPPAPQVNVIRWYGDLIPTRTRTPGELPAPASTFGPGGAPSALNAPAESPAISAAIQRTRDLVRLVPWQLRFLPRT